MPAVVKKLLQAEADIILAAECYDDQATGLGETFIRAVDLAMESVNTPCFIESGSSASSLPEALSSIELTSGHSKNRVKA